MNGSKGWAWTGFLLGIVVSIAANVAHTWYPIQAHGPGWVPPIGAQAAAGFYPVAVLLTVELMSRVPWPDGWWWGAARFGGVGIVAAVAAVVSYRHMYALLLVYGEDQTTASIGPLAVDGLMVVASFALLAIGRAERVRPVAAVAAVAEEVAETDEEAEAERRRGVAVVTPEMRARAVERLQADPETTGADLGRLLEVSPRTGLRLKNEIEAELDQTTPGRVPTFANENDVNAPLPGM